MAEKRKDSFPEVMTVAQLAAYLQLNPQVVYRHVREGHIPATRIGQTLRFPKRVVDAWLESGAWHSVGASPPELPTPPAWDVEHD